VSQWRKPQRNLKRDPSTLTKNSLNRIISSGKGANTPIRNSLNKKKKNSSIHPSQIFLQSRVKLILKAKMTKYFRQLIFFSLIYSRFMIKRKRINRKGRKKKSRCKLIRKLIRKRFKSSCLFLKEGRSRWGKRKMCFQRLMKSRFILRFCKRTFVAPNITGKLNPNNIWFLNFIKTQHKFLLNKKKWLTKKLSKTRIKKAQKKF